jgi:hypothetical protein
VLLFTHLQLRADLRFNFFLDFHKKPFGGKSREEEEEEILRSRRRRNLYGINTRATWRKGGGRSGGGGGGGQIMRRHTLRTNVFYFINYPLLMQPFPELYMHFEPSQFVG